MADLRRVKPEGRADVLIAGPPCQGFSTLGKRDPGDPRNRLSLEVVAWAKTLEASVVVVENVSTFLDSPVATKLQRRLAALGYEVETLVIDALDFGVPQRRKRSFVVASRVGSVILEAGRRKRFARTVRGAWEGLPVRADGRNQHYAPQPSALARARMEKIPEGGDKRDIMAKAPHLTAPSWWRMGCQVTDAWGRLAWEEPSNTLRTCLPECIEGSVHPSKSASSAFAARGCTASQCRGQLVVRGASDAGGAADREQRSAEPRKVSGKGRDVRSRWLADVVLSLWLIVFERPAKFEQIEMSLFGLFDDTNVVTDSYRRVRAFSAESDEEVAAPLSFGLRVRHCADEVPVDGEAAALLC